MTEKNVFRFAVGTPEYIQSSVWRFFVQGNEVYLGVREYLHAIKVSLHSSGIWRIAFVEKIEKPDVRTDRVIVKWQRPAEFINGWTGSVAILISSIEPNRSFSNQTEFDDKHIKFFKPPSTGNKYLFKVLFSSPEISDDEWKKIILPNDQLACQLKKRNGEKVWLLLREENLTINEEEIIRDTMKKIKINLKPGIDINSITSPTRAILIDSEDEPDITKQPTLIDIPLGKENIEFK